MLSQATSTVIAIDYGLKRLGTACGDSSLKITHPLMTINKLNKQEKITALKELVKEWNPTFWVLGVPFQADGSTSEFTRACLNFAHLLHEKTKLTVYLVNERYSSCYADELLSEQPVSSRKKKQVLDQVAAQAILMAFFNDGAYQCINKTN